MKPFVSLIALSSVVPLFATVLLRGQEAVEPGWADAQRQVAKATAEAKEAQAVAQEQLERARQEGNRALDVYDTTSSGWGWGGRFGAAGGALIGGPGRSPVVIRFSELEAKAQSNLEEDLAVMGHIVDKVVGEVRGQHPYHAMGIDVFFVPGPGRLRSLYLEGYGALFVANVNFPLVPPATKPAEEEKEPTDPTWEEARQEVYGKSFENKVSTEQEPYREETVKKLKKRLLAALKSATHIRELKPEEAVTVCVFGGASSSGVSYKPTASRNETTTGTSKKMLVLATNSSTQGTVLTIRVAKADVDAFAKGELTLDAFTQKAKVKAYAGNVISGAGMGNFSSF